MVARRGRIGLEQHRNEDDDERHHHYRPDNTLLVAAILHGTVCYQVDRV
jgi:hypothetical protein